MTKQLTLILLIGFLIVGCSTSPLKSRLESKVVVALDLDSLVNQEKYNLNILNEGNILVYKYINTLDSSKNMTFRFNTKTEVLAFGPFEFKKAVDNYYSNSKLSSSSFDLYNLREPVIDGNGPMLFNEKYGVLNVDNTSWTYQYLFFPEGQENIDLSMQIIRKLKMLESIE